MAVRVVREETILREAKQDRKRFIEALSNRSMTRDGATSVAYREGGFVVIEENGGFLPCKWVNR